MIKPDQSQTAQFPEAERAAVQAMEKLGGRIVWDMKDASHPFTFTKVSLRGKQVTDTEVKVVKKLKSLQYLDLAFTRLTHKELKKRTTQPYIRELCLGNTQATDVGPKKLNKWGLNGTQVTDAVLTELKQLQELRELQLVDT